MPRSEKVEVLFNGIMWIIRVKVMDKGVKRIKGKPVRSMRTEIVLESEDFREIKAALEERGLSVWDPKVKFNIRSDALPEPDLSMPDSPFSGPFDCLIPMPGVTTLVPDDIDLWGLICLQTYTDESGGLFCPPDLLEGIGIKWRRFKRAWPG